MSHRMKHLLIQFPVITLFAFIVMPLRAVSSQTYWLAMGAFLLFGILNWIEGLGE